LGRAAELAALGELLADANHRLITIVGPGGVGKTCLAIAAAEANARAFADGAVYVPLVGVDDADLLPATLLTALELPSQPDQTAEGQLIAYLKDRELLLVLDNLEQLLAGVGLLARLIQQTSAVTLLVTSRERLALRAEWIFDLAGLPVPPLNSSHCDLERSPGGAPVCPAGAASPALLHTGRRRRSGGRHLSHRRGAAAGSRVGGQRHPPTVLCRDRNQPCNRHGRSQQRPARSPGATTQPSGGLQLFLAATYGGRAARAPPLIRLSGWLGASGGSSGGGRDGPTAAGVVQQIVAAAGGRWALCAARTDPPVCCGPPPGGGRDRYNITAPFGGHDRSGSTGGARAYRGGTAALAGTPGNGSTTTCERHWPGVGASSGLPRPHSLVGRCGVSGGDTTICARGASGWAGCCTASPRANTI
ncbi:hypothetical protein HC891_25335, partial [Candidatus Gracilibacteria bacterium]|nr:hypothetical protein [Candidatus Gracilibacteria bacterium]